MRHRFHSLCPYFAMFPEDFVAKHLAASRFDGMVFDPFCGRGTTLFEALLSDRDAAGCDIHPVATCVSGAKCDPPSLDELQERISVLETDCTIPNDGDWAGELEGFFIHCFHPDTLIQIRYLRSALKWETHRADRFLAAICLGALHGESHRSRNYFSNRMPRTISTKPGYSVLWWKERGYRPPCRDVFEILRRMIAYRYRSTPPNRRGQVRLADARTAGEVFADLKGRVSDIITSPPYLDTTNYREDQWLRLWFLGGDPRIFYSREDGRHYNKAFYWEFLEQVWFGLRMLLDEKVRIVVRIGGRRLDKDETREGLIATLEHGLQRPVSLIDDGVTSLAKKTQANTFRGGRISPTVEHDFCFIVN